MNYRSALLEEIRDRHWFHTIDLGGGVVTRGNPPNPVLTERGAIPDVAGRTVLDIGTWDGKYAFEAERAGAARVVALDHYVWRLNAVPLRQYLAACEADGRLPEPDMVRDGFLIADGVPGRRGFDLAKEYLGSWVEPWVGDFATMDLEPLGSFDVVLFFGVLYHMVDPVSSLQRLRQVTGHVAAIETLATNVPGYPDSSLLEFYPGKEMVGDYTNWFAPSERALHDMCRAAGFARVETRVCGPSSVATGPAWRRRLALLRGRERPYPYRIVVHAYR